MMDTQRFTCDKCGLCCSHLHLFGDAYKFLDRGDDICKYFNIETKLCTIYKERPIICNIEKGYHIFFRNIPYDEYIKQNQQACKMLKKYTNEI